MLRIRTVVGSNKEEHRWTLRVLRQSDENPVKGRRQPRRGFARINVDQEGIRASFGQDCGKVFARVRQGLEASIEIVESTSALQVLP